MRNSSDHSLDPSLAAAPRELPRVTYGIAAGAMGATVVAAVLFAWDVVTGQPLHSPATLGHALFAREVLPAGAAYSAPQIVGYTLVHGSLWTGLGLLSAAVLETVPALPRGTGRTLGLAVALFACIEAVFFGFSEIFLIPGLKAQLGAGPVAVANAAAAAVMAGYLSSKRWRRPTVR